MVREHLLRRSWPLLCLALLTLVAGLWVPLAGNFPTNDDWAYSLVVRHLLESGRVQLNGWVVASFLFQMAWGALFCLPFGFSFAALRVSTLAMGLLGVAALYGLLREYGFERRTCFLGALTLAVNPLFLSLDFSFMTDVPALATSLCAALFTLRGFRREAPRWLLLGSCFALAAYLVRQVTLVLPVSFALCELSRRRPWRLALRDLIAMLALPVAGALAHWVWLHWLVGVPEFYNARRWAPPEAAAWRAPGLVFGILVYAGLFLLPLWAALLPDLRRQAAGAGGRLVVACWTVAVLGVASFLIFQVGVSMPYLGNVLGDLGLGSRTLRDVFILKQAPPLRLPRAAWDGVSLVGALGAAFLGAAATLHLRRSRGLDPLVLSGLLMLGGFLLMDDLFDRYLIALLPPAIVGTLLALDRPRARLAVGSVLATGFFAFSLMGVTDYMSWNRARWQAARYAVETLGSPPERVDGGFEWGGWMSYESFGAPHDPFGPVSWWWVRDPRYVVSFDRIEGWRPVKAFPYPSPFSRTPLTILLSEPEGKPHGAARP